MGSKLPYRLHSPTPKLSDSTPQFTPRQSAPSAIPRPKLGFGATGITLTYPSGEVVQCESLVQAESFLDHLDNVHKAS